jgi:hypothetical protein
MGRKTPNRLSRLMNLQFHNTGATISTESMKPSTILDEPKITVRNQPAVLELELEMESTSIEEDADCIGHRKRSSASSLCTASKKVRFGECAVRSYAQVLGDHPSCSLGCPLELGWDYQQFEAVSVDDYTGTISSSSMNTARCDLRMTWEERRAILLLDPDNTDVDLRRACRKFQRHRTKTSRGRKQERSSFFASCD